MTSGWYLEHVATGEKIFLHYGDNVMGSSPFCKIIFCAPFKNIARKHANLIINDDQVKLKPLTDLNEIFIDDTRVDNSSESPLTEGSVITLGIKPSSLVVPGNRAVFTLKKMGPCVDEMDLVSEDGDSQNLNKTPLRRSLRVRNPPLRYRSPKFLVRKRK
ncbi:uncharacterized protein Dana_GF27386 [Drosophila ananassae]|uniref:FHA domain-containing protein n=1 Tax=Drosophila ananassae TaxID=7217 RepID=A0A0P8XSR1_DROAN|nr:uncharacterized protein LOC123257125 [Drosophila ananassae]KPU77745.1 uncharacterized protein Dana_GF27386 [Drosophila ananassae]